MHGLTGYRRAGTSKAATRRLLGRETLLGGALMLPGHTNRDELDDIAATRGLRVYTGLGDT